MGQDLKDQELTQHNIFISRRLSGEPVAYITGHKEFMSLDFCVDKSVLIPRPETELLVEKALEIMPPLPFIVDVGTGSGAIAVSLAYYNREARVFAIDRSLAALAVARDNCIRHSVSDRVELQPGDLLQPLVGSAPAGAVDLIAANLPYVAEGDLLELPGEVRMFEPRLALAGGRDGLAHYRRLIPQAIACLKEGGYLLMEIGFDQGLVPGGFLIHSSGRCRSNRIWPAWTGWLWPGTKVRGSILFKCEVVYCAGYENMLHKGCSGQPG